MSNWDSSDRSSRLPSNWKALREATFRRDGYQCTWVDFENGTETRCVQPAEECDHAQRGDNHSPANLRSLCAKHHQYKTNRERGSAYTRFKPRKRTSQPHVGLG